MILAERVLRAMEFVGPDETWLGWAKPGMRIQVTLGPGGVPVIELSGMRLPKRCVYHISRRFNMGTLEARRDTIGALAFALVQMIGELDEVLEEAL